MRGRQRLVMLLTAMLTLGAGVATWLVQTPFQVEAQCNDDQCAYGSGCYSYNATTACGQGGTQTCYGTSGHMYWSPCV